MIINNEKIILKGIENQFRAVRIIAWCKSKSENVSYDQINTFTPDINVAAFLSRNVRLKSKRHQIK